MSAPPPFPLCSGAVLLLGALACSSAARAEVELPAVTVSVNKQKQNLDRVPGSIRVFSAEEIEDAGASSLADLAAMIPGFALQPMGQSGLLPPVMRGLTGNIISFSASSALVVDGVATLRAQGFDNHLLGVNSIEILRGPQSTLYGRNAEAGVVNIVTRQPDNTPYAAVSIDTGSRNKLALRADASQALVEDVLYLGVGGEFSQQEGFIDNTHAGKTEDDRERHGGRLTLRWTPEKSTDVSLRMSQQEYRDGGSLWGPAGGQRERVRSGTASWNRSKSNSLSLDVAHEFTSGLRLRSITANNEYFDRILQDTDFEPADRTHLGRDYHFRTLSQEMRLEGKLGNSTWLAGLYLDRDDNKLNFENKTPLALSRTASTQSGTAAALFTHWEIPLSERWSLKGGARLERDEIRFRLAGAGEQSREWTRLTPKLALEYQAHARALLYGSIADGFRAGGFNTFAPANKRSYEPEKLRSYEIGLKGTLLNHRLRYSTALYRMDIDDMQVQQMGAVMGQVFITNAAAARSSGAETELRWLLGNGWQVQAGLGLNHTRFREFRDGTRDYAGKRNPFAPDINAHLGLRYDAQDGWFIQTTLSGYGKIFVDAANTAAYRRPGYAIVNLAIGRNFGNTSLTAYLNNAADKRYDTVGFPGSTITQYSPPRELGLRLNWHL